MNFHILTLFPEMIDEAMNKSIIGREIENNTISLETVNIRDFSTNKHKKVDDYTYGGGAGMLTFQILIIVSLNAETYFWRSSIASCWLKSLPPPHLGNSNTFDCTRFVVGSVIC